ncbi:MAG: HD family phosphohydrolase [Candidatus Moranbacteria bacterium]|nr:HD family phosphohydrolase [Candidatus Moranbacteria bacterium]
MQSEKTKRLELELKKIYQKHGKRLPFHGWHHIEFVHSKSLEFAGFIKANIFLVESAVLCHDLNYLVKPNSDPELGEKLRRKILINCGYSLNEIGKIESIIMESHTAYRGRKISPEGKALSDADSLFKVLPISPILFSNQYIIQNKVDIQKLSKKITSEQNKLLAKNIYFYIPAVRKRYLPWAKTNLTLWNQVSEALKDKDVLKLISK